MPQGRPELHERFGDDSAAWDFLSQRGWTHLNGVMFLPVGQQPDEEEWDAAEYLCDEWDWGIER